MQIGHYIFTPVHSQEDVPTGSISGVILLEVKDSGLLHLLPAEVLSAAYRKLKYNKAGAALERAYPENLLEHVNVYYWKSGDRYSNSRHKDIICTAITERLFDETLRRRYENRKKPGKRTYRVRNFLP